MLLSNLIRYKLLILLLGGIFASNFKAQTPVCNLQIDVFELSNEQPTKTVDNIKAILTEPATKKTIKSSDFIKMPVFTDLTSGKYRIEIIKDGYQRRVKEFEFNCKMTDEKMTISKVLYLQKGDSKKVTKFDSGVYTLKSEGEQYKTNSNESAVNNKAAVPAKPTYPAAARAVRASGTVQVQVTIDVDGEIVEAKAISGHPLLKQAAEKSATESRFAPTLLKGQPVIIKGIIVYNFLP